MRAVLIPMARGDFAVPVEVVQEVVAAPSVAPLHGAPRTVLGNFDLRGEAVPVVDTVAALGGTEPTSVAYAVVASCRGDLVALASPVMPAMVALPGEAQPSQTPGTTGTYLLDERTVTVIDLPELLAHAGLGVDDLAVRAG